MEEGEAQDALIRLYTILEKTVKDLKTISSYAQLDVIVERLEKELGIKKEEKTDGKRTKRAG